ncbi:cation-dependent mannose-6-phosphate receptor [Pleurodeles waltl]|uniref:cation-dependent mannose-6-phosphate receptor n=1 Tax=Pleurodeles waltl TaxID=8319 RepID=UPI0037098E2C
MGIVEKRAVSEHGWICFPGGATKESSKGTFCRGMAQFPIYSWSAVMFLTLAGRAVGDLDCNLAGEDKQESELEKAVLASLAPLRNRMFSQRITQGSSDYTYNFTVCGTAGNTSKPGAGLVQIDNKDGKETVVGRIDDTDIVRGTDWILLMYGKGDKYNNHCGGEERRAMIMISCSPKTIAANFMMVNEERTKVEACFYLFEMDSSVACPPEDTRLSVGSILLIVLASLVALYLIVGFLYQRLVVGAKGMEQIPNYSFWQDLGNLMADGCDFACRSKPRNVTTAYRGVGDDQLGEEQEERDDHLLPM